MQVQSSTQISQQECAARAFGMSIGNLFLGFFGMAWIVLGLMAVGQINLPMLTIAPEKMKPLVLAILIAFLAILAVSSVYIIR